MRPEPTLQGFARRRRYPSLLLVLPMLLLIVGVTLTAAWAHEGDEEVATEDGNGRIVYHGGHAKDASKKDKDAPETSTTSHLGPLTRVVDHELGVVCYATSSLLGLNSLSCVVLP